ncbi:MAG: helix-turn-helix domain-containing protein [Chitinophagaceae bacterium]|nr:helix-turn-helix domain-containing protein [Chitinophagaceae bacterium]
MSSNIRIQRVCQYCHQLFTARTTVTRYCSHNCNSKDYKRQQKNIKIRASNVESREIILKEFNNAKAIGVFRIYFNMKELSVITNVSERTLFRLIKREGFPKIKIGRRLLFNKEKVINFINLKYGIFE